MFAEGSVQEVYIDGFSHNGEGIGRVDGKVIFVAGAIPGETVIAKITEKGKSFARAEIVEIKNAFPDRRDPGAGGYSHEGCGLAHISYVGQLKLKKTIVSDAVERIGKIKGVKINDVLGMENPAGYRNRGHFHVERRFGEAKFGFYEEGSRVFVPAGRSFLYSDSINSLLKKLEKLLDEEKISIYEESRRTGFLRNLFVRESRKTGEIMLVFVTNGEEKLPEEFIRRTAEAEAKIASLWQNVNTGKFSSMPGRKYIHLYGTKTIEDSLGRYSFELSPETFFQVNNSQTEKLYGAVEKYAGLTGKETVLDAYGGIGTIGIWLAGKADKVISVENVSAAKKDGIRSAEKNGIKNIKFVTAQVENWLPAYVKKEGKADVLVLDPPRGGCKKEVLFAALRAEPEKIIYVSCNPAALARDLNILKEKYTVEEIQPVDMFPGTSHIESVVLLQKQ